ncbi:nucleoside triphosphate pyrophosphohydrolase, partial [Cyanobium sp. LEGE 06143]|uniref:nucleoside triphosphate pyrophosphohydrolase n=1 Tax=Cyanobium sp. LEGE 06143 TaxID=945727 RepID=UPI001D133C83
MPADPSLNALAELIAVVARLRDPAGGCPWDLEQTHASLLPYVLEEAHEVADAIRHGNDDHLSEELGDLLLQVVLHAQIAREAGRFDLEAIARGLSAKLIRRHPHVFAGAEAKDSAAVRASWAAIKAAERPQQSASPVSERLGPKVRSQPALAGAMAISRQAAAAGFEWDDLSGVWEKVHEELDELKEAVASGDRAHAQEELGDVLFTLVNVARWCGIDPESGLAGTNHRFLDRFSRVEAALGGDLGGRTIRELEGLWQQAKAAIRAEAAQVGYPLMLKASWGGGGRGMRPVYSEKELAEKVMEGRREAEAAFGNGEGYLEKMILKARHVEVQILGDKHGEIYHLWERDCSVQRRNQKVVERAPAPYLTQAQREELCELGRRICAHVNYECAGTVEFLMDMADDKFYFIEVNPRVQVGHTVTEAVTGIDIVQA